MTDKSVDVLLVGAGAMSSTLATLLHELEPNLTLCMVERLEHVARESTDGWNNAGTGHAAYCELNYTPEDQEGSVNIDKALKINAQFEVSLQLWSYLVNSGKLPSPERFINQTPHISFVWGEKNVEFLRKRYALMSAHHLFDGMEYTEDRDTIAQWAPLIMADRDLNEPVAATRVNHGTDVDFGSIARNMVKHLQNESTFDLHLGHSVEELTQLEDKTWNVKVEPKLGKAFNVNAKFVFLGAGGGALPLLQKSDIPEADGYGGFPVSGQWLVCTNQKIVKQHHAKVYGKAAIGAPPMSVPHLDSRTIGDANALLFGPFAGFTTKFLKHGSKLDLIGSLQLDNIKPIMNVGMKNMDLTKYLITEVFQSERERIDSLRDYFPNAQNGNWSVADAGQRVQIIKKDGSGKGKLEFGTEIVSSADGSLAALLGASPGASTSVNTMLEVLERCFKEQFENDDWGDRLRGIIPSYGDKLVENESLARSIREANIKTLNIGG